MCATRINARLDAQAAEQVDFLTAATGLGVSHVLRESVARYYVQVKGQRAGLANFGALVGQGDSGRSDIASDTKRHVGDAIGAKVRPPPAASKRRAAK